MKRFFSFFRRLFNKKSKWDGMDYGVKPAIQEDEFAKLNGER